MCTSTTYLWVTLTLRQASTFRTLPISLSFSSPFLFRICSIPCASRDPFLFRLCSIVFMLRGPFLFMICLIPCALRGPFLFRLCFVACSGWIYNVSSFEVLCSLFGSLLFLTWRRFEKNNFTKLQRASRQQWSKHKNELLTLIRVHVWWLLIVPKQDTFTLHHHNTVLRLLKFKYEKLSDRSESCQCRKLKYTWFAWLTQPPIM